MYLKEAGALFYMFHDRGQKQKIEIKQKKSQQKKKRIKKKV